MDLSSFLSFSFTRYALVSVVLLSVISGVVGSYIVSRRMVFAAGGITHASFGGIGLAYFFGLNPTLGALVFSVATALCVNWASSRGRVRHDSAIAMLWSLGMAIGVIFLSLSPGYAPNLMGFMFGDLLAVSLADVVANSVTAFVVVLCAIIFYRPLLYSSFDPVYARLAGWRPSLVSAVAAVLVALSISLSIKAVGIILVLSVFSIPQAIAMSFVYTLPRVMLLSSIVAFIGCLLGLVLSFVLDLPSGAVITAVLSLSLLLVKFFRR